MKKTFILTLAIILIAFVGFSQTEKYARIKIYADEIGLNKLASLGIPIDNGTSKKGIFIITELSEKDIKTVVTNGFKYEILINDMAKYYAERNEKIDNVNVNEEYTKKLALSWPVPTGFTLGSMGGFSTYNEFLAHLDNIVSLYPNLITAKQPISSTINSIEGRPIYFVKITNLSNGITNKPQVLFTGMHHAREPIGMEHLLYFMYYILQHYNTDINIKNLIDYTEIYIVPVVNPDGYIYNQTTNPTGGGMWRKNRRNNGGSYGVDINRNYGYMWGHDNVGSSNDPTSETYRGTAAFSEPEIQIIRDFCNAHNFKIALNYHSYSNDFLYPWGYQASVTPDESLFQVYSQIMTAENHYTYGPTAVTLYVTNGDSNDWMYGEQTSKPKIFPWVPEIGNNSDGFWPSSSRIIPLCQENMWQSLQAAYLVGNYAKVKETSPYNVSQLTGYFKFDIQRLGLQDTPNFTVSIVPIGGEIQTVGSPKTFNAMTLLETRNDSISFVLNPALTGCQQFKFLISVNNGLYTNSDTITKVFGQSVALLNDNCNTITNWTTTNTWGITTSQYHSATGSITDSPSGNYASNQGATNSITMTNSIDLHNKCFATLSYWAKWDIEAGWDFAQVKISTNNGTNWTPLTGKYTHPGGSNQIEGSPLYDGTQSTWVKEEIDLSNYVGQNIKIRFTLQSDGNVVGDGFYFDDLSVSSIDGTVGIREPNSLISNYISNAIPNPATTDFQLNYSLNKEINNSILYIYNSMGNEVYSLQLPNNKGNINITTLNWQKGIYFYMIKANNYRSEIKKLIIL